MFSSDNKFEEIGYILFAISIFSSIAFVFTISEYYAFLPLAYVSIVLIFVSLFFQVSQIKRNKTLTSIIGLALCVIMLFLYVSLFFPLIDRVISNNDTCDDAAKLEIVEDSCKVSDGTFSLKVKRDTEGSDIRGIRILQYYGGDPFSSGIIKSNLPNKGEEVSISFEKATPDMPIKIGVSAAIKKSYGVDSCGIDSVIDVSQCEHF